MYVYFFGGKKLELNILGYDKFEIYPIVKKIKELYGYYSKKYVCMKAMTSGDDMNVYTVMERLDEGIIINHLAGNYAVGTFAGERATKFICIDIDDGDEFTVRKVINSMVAMGIPEEKIYLSYSGKKGYHVELFFRDYLRNDYARAFYILLIDKSGCNPHKVEFRPTNKQAIKVPLGVHQVTGNRCWYLDKETMEPIKDLRYILQIEMIPQADMQKIVDENKGAYYKKIYAEYESEKDACNAEPKQERMIIPHTYDLTLPGTRHKMQVKVAMRARSEGKNRSGIYYEQMNWYARQDKSLISSTEREVQDDANRIADWVVKHIVPTPWVTKKDTAGLEKKAPDAIITKEDLPYILSAPTPSARRLALLLWIYCRRYGEAKIAIHTLMAKTGLSYRGVILCIQSLIDKKIIRKKESKTQKGIQLAVKDSNTYMLPERLRRTPPQPSDLICERFVINDWITDNINEVYNRMLAAMCKDEYLKKYLKVPELKKVMEYRERMRKDAGESADHDADRSA